jgi:uncharacterized protein YpmB
MSLRGAVISVLVVIIGIMIGAISVRYFGKNNPVEEEAEDVVDAVVKAETGITLPKISALEAQGTANAAQPVQPQPEPAKVDSGQNKAAP